MRLPLEIYRPLVAAGLVKELPTSRLYLLDHLPFLGAGRPLPAARIAANVFTVGDTAFVVRETDEAGLAAARRAKRVAWIVDDHYGEGAASADLPEGYRRRLDDLHTRFEPAMLAITDTVLASCDGLAEVYRRQGIADVRVVHPFYPVALARRPEAAGEVSVGILQTRSHLADLRSIVPQLAEVLTADPAVRIVHCLAGTDTGLGEGGRIEALKPMSWRAYLRWDRPLALGLYPLLDTGFNRYRSLNKVFEYVARGAVPLVADVAAMAAVPAEYRVAACGWRDRILELARDGAERRRLVERARDWIAGERFAETTRSVLADLVG